MTNRIAFWLAGIVLVFILADAVLSGQRMTLFLAQKLVDLIEWLAFWR